MVVPTTIGDALRTLPCYAICSKGWTVLTLVGCPYPNLLSAEIRTARPVERCLACEADSVGTDCFPRARRLRL